MTIHARRRLFYGLFAAFLVLGTSVIFYVSGWRFDPGTLSLRKVGAIFVRSFPREARIILDKKPVENNSGFFQNGTLINNLFPKTYELELSLGGYKPWREKVPVAPSLVSDEKSAVLIPETTETIATGTIARFTLLGDTPILQNKKGGLSVNGIKIGSGEVTGSTNDLSKILVFNSASGTYSLFNSATATRTNLNAALKKAGLGASQKFKIILDPYDTQNVIVLETAAIVLFNTNTQIISPEYKTSGAVLKNIAASQFFFAWTEWNSKANTSTLVIYDKFLHKTQSTAENIRGKNTKLQWAATSEIALLQDDGSFYTYDRNKDALAKIADDVKDFSFTSNASAAAALEHKALEVFFFNQDKDYYRFNLPRAQSATSIEWYADQSHLFVHYPSEVKFLDLKDGAMINFEPVVQTSFASYDEKTNALYFVANDGLKKIDFPK